MKALKTFIITGLAGLSFLAGPAVLAEDKLPSGTSYQDIGSKIEAFVEEHKDTTAGMETAVVTADDTLYEGHFGYVNKEKNIKADENAVFEWGSTTKTLTWISVMQQVEAGKLDLKEDIRTYLPKDFLKNLRYDRPITLLDLMNHRAGFQESYTRMTVAEPDDRLSIKDYLTQVQPPQIYEPDTVTAYSNWGTALTGYIIERISGQPYADYVHQHVFQPLGMRQSAIAPDQSDNPWVQKQRQRNHSYDTTGQNMGKAYYYTNDSPAGAIISSLTDLKTYAQALLKQEAGVLFQKKETWKELFSTSQVYEGTDVPLNRHGFWVQEYATQVTGHGGAMPGYTNGFLLDLKNKVGLVIMTNQPGEQVYNRQMPELVFGSYQDSALAKQPKKEPAAGHYLYTRSIQEGPLALMMKPAAIIPVGSGKDSPLTQQLEQSYYSLSRLPDGRDRISLEMGDFVKLSDFQVWLIGASFWAAGLAVLYALGYLVFGGLAWLWRKVLKKTSQPKRPQTWQRIVAGLITATALTIGAFYYLVMSDSELLYLHRLTWLIALLASLTLALIGTVLWRFINRPKEKQDWRYWLDCGLISLAGCIVIWFIYYWDLYQWWVT